MPRQCSLGHRHRSRTQQFDLFGAPDSGAAQRRQWQALPAQTRQALTELMVRLILDHVDEARHPQPREARHDV